MERVWVDERAAFTLQRAGLVRLADFVALLGQAGAFRPVQVALCTLPNGQHGTVEVYCKRYAFRRASWRFWLRASKARREFDNYAVFEELGIRCARRLACAEGRDRVGRLREAVILTEAVPNTVTLREYAAQPHSVGIRREILRRLAEMTRRLHDADFFHNDLRWHNILVQTTEGTSPALWWIDCPRGSRARVPIYRHHRLVKDLAVLDRDAADHCSETDRLRFLLAYLRLPQLDRSAKRLIREILESRYRRPRQRRAGDA